MTEPTVLEVGFNKLRVDCKIGAYKKERGKRQRLLVSVRLRYAKSLSEKAGYSDKLEDAIDYADVADIVKRVCKEKHHDLLEHLAARIDAGLEHEMPFWSSIEVFIEKPSALNDAKAGVCRWYRER